MTLIAFMLCLVGIVALLIVAYDYYKGVPLCKVLYIVIAFGIVCISLSTYNMIMFTDEKEVNFMPAFIWGIYDDGTYKYMGYTDSIQEPKYWKKPIRYVTYNYGGGYTWNFTETSQDGYLMIINMHVYWGESDQHSYVGLSEEKLKSMVNQYGPDWPQKLMKPSEDYVRKYIRTHTWQYILADRSPPDAKLNFETGYTMPLLGFCAWTNDEIHLADSSLESQFWDNREYETLRPYAASVGVTLDKPENYEEYVTPISTRPQYNSYTDSEGVVHLDGLYSDGTYYENTEDLIDHLKE